MKIKICGLTSLDDALAAAEAGADMLGFNFHAGSPRRISPARCAEIVEGLEAHNVPVQTVGVFVNSSPASVAGTLEMCGLHLAQLHGDEPPSDFELLGERAFKAVRPRSLAEAKGLARQYAPLGTHEPALLIDARVGGKYGGTGIRVDWDIAAQLARELPLLLAGGLSPDNVRQAIRSVFPWGVDVASGVENVPGLKDRHRMAAFVQAVRKFTRETEDAE
jgi:phosphoribosylanthranilate isomerase